MSENNIIKAISVIPCPHCKEDIYLESQMTPPAITSSFTKQDIENAKADCISRVETLAIDEEKKEQVIKWLNEETTVFGPDEVENIILSLLKPAEEE